MNALPSGQLADTLFYAKGPSSRSAHYSSDTKLYTVLFDPLDHW